MHGNVAQLGLNTLKRFKLMDETLDSVEYCLSMLKALIGDRPDSLGTSTIFQVLEDVVEQLSNENGVAFRTSTPVLPSEPRLSEQDVKAISSRVVERKLAPLDSTLKSIQRAVPGFIYAEAKNGIHTELFLPMSLFQQNFARPMLTFLQRWSASPAQLGSKLEDAFRAADNRLTRLESQLGAAIQGMAGTGPIGLNAAPPSTQGGNVNPLTRGNVSQTNPTTSGSQAAGVTFAGPVAQKNSTGVDLVALAEAIRRLRDDVDAIRDQMEAESVEIPTETFRSKSECAVWLAAQNANASVYLFVDPISFLSLCTCDAHESEQDASNQRATTVKIRDSNTYQTAYIGSYSLEVPPLLGKGVNADATRATRTLAAAPTFEDFHPGGGNEGIKERIMHYVKDGMRT